MATRRRRIARAAACLAIGLTLVLVPTAPMAPTALADKGSNPYKTPGEANGAKPPIVLAKSWVVADATTGDVLAAKHPHMRLRPASTIKALTAVTLLPLLDKSEVYTVEWKDAARIGSTVGIVPDATYTIDDLFYGLLLPSGNDAAHALANAAGGTRKTVRLMNAEAIKLGASETTVRNPTGLDAKGQYSSAFDLALFAQAGLERSDFRRYVGTATTAFPAEMPKENKKRKTYQIYNQNPLLLSGFRGTLGVKTGFTTLAGSTFVAAVRRGGHTYIVSLMGLAEPSEVAARRLYDWVFRTGHKLEPLENLNTRPDQKTARPDPAAAVVSDIADEEPAAAGWGSPWIAVLVALGAIGALAVTASRRARR